MNYWLSQPDYPEDWRKDWAAVCFVASRVFSLAKGLKSEPSPDGAQQISEDIFEAMVKTEVEAKQLGHDVADINCHFNWGKNNEVISVSVTCPRVGSRLTVGQE